MPLKRTKIRELGLAGASTNTPLGELTALPYGRPPCRFTLQNLNDLIKGTSVE